ncbi:protocatechuate 3,4-dioxygenase subunit alpha [Pseudonocardia endophytica]|uniref:Protocatechuate 3,4-dioxygenase alpha subunit n=1 Tax=Pseudonocardia endophytica TaxID=401976 RepID=A0A4R1I7G9_PSEEN|nr:protocatechuate 3,4-dioxygenase subunit alpha [Pseudonocardia endophytica]TCK26062.1 protocatechuate 3,4-dioxygenase alpha subunit [Pseudonocardia endophytica]
MTVELTPSQTVGPFLSIGLIWDDGPDVVPEGTPGRVTIGGTVSDGAGDPVTDALVETWQADPDGRFDHPDDPRGARETPGFRAFGRSATDADGRWEIHTLLPAALPGEAPHLDVSVFARGLLDRVVTRIYLPDHPDNATDPLLTSVPEARRDTLIAVREQDDRLRFDVRLQGAGETVFLAL